MRFPKGRTLSKSFTSLPQNIWSFLYCSLDSSDFKAFIRAFSDFPVCFTRNLIRSFSPFLLTSSRRGTGISGSLYFVPLIPRTGSSALKTV